MKNFIMNDYELIYLIRFELDEIALSFMFKKYHKFIWKNIHLFQIDEKEREDFHQEGTLMLNKAITSFDDNKNKSFTRYFELILKRHIYQMKKRIPNYILFDHTDYVKGCSYIEEETEEIEFNSTLEQVVFERYFMNRQKIKEIENQTDFSKKQIYNTIYRIKEKYKIMI